MPVMQRGLGILARCVAWTQGGLRATPYCNGLQLVEDSLSIARYYRGLPRQRRAVGEAVQAGGYSASGTSRSSCSGTTGNSNAT